MSSWLLMSTWILSLAALVGSLSWVTRMLLVPLSVRGKGDTTRTSPIWRTSPVSVGTTTWNDCIAVVLVLGSVAVTLMVEVSPALALVASMWTTPLGLLLDRVAETMLIGLIGCIPRLLGRGVAATLVIWFTTP